MSPHITSLVVAFKTITLILGGLITYYAYKAYRRTRSPSLRAVTLGFALVTLGSLLAGAAHQAFGLNPSLVLSVESALTAIGFAIILYSLYAE